MHRGGRKCPRLCKTSSGFGSKERGPICPFDSIGAMRNVSPRMDYLDAIGERSMTQGDSTEDHGNLGVMVKF